MAEGRTKATYVSDIIRKFDNTGASVAATFTVDTANNLFLQAPFGWAAAPAGQIRRPKRMTPRHVVGVSPAGKRVKAIVATLAADLWTGVASTWTYIDNFGATIVATVTGRVGEKATL